MATLKARYLGDEAHAEWLGLGDNKIEIEERATQAGINPANLQWESMTPAVDKTLEQKFETIAPAFHEQRPDLPGAKPFEMPETKMPESTEDLQAGQVEPFVSPEPQAPSITESFTGSMLANLEKQRATLDSAYQKQLETIQKNLEESQKKQDALMDKQEGILEGDVARLTEPFREEKEKSERQRLDVEKNYFANQQLVDELDGLLTGIQADLQAQKDVTGLASIRNPRIQKSMEDAEARIGVINSVMAARNGQIEVANNLIDRTVTAMTADRQDRLDYYEDLLLFYSGQSDTEGAKIIQLTSDEKTAIDNQTSLIKADLKQTQDNVDYIKNLMRDPSTAQIVAQSGVTLNDTPEQVSQKFSNFAYQQEIVDMNNKMEAQGYNYVATPEQLAGKDRANLQYLTDSKGKSRVYYKEPEAIIPSEGGTGITYEPELSEYDKARQFITDNPDASDDELFNGIRENTNLAITDVRSLIDSREKPQFLNEEYVRNIFTEAELKAKAKEAGFTAGGSGLLGFAGIGVGPEGIQDYMNALLAYVNSYREQGYSDEEIEGWLDQIHDKYLKK